jgi:hypothetical protein
LPRRQRLQLPLLLPPPLPLLPLPLLPLPLPLLPLPPLLPPLPPLLLMLLLLLLLLLLQRSRNIEFARLWMMRWPSSHKMVKKKHKNV